MGNPVERYLKDYGQGQGDPVDDYLKDFGPTQTTAQAAPAKPPEESKLKQIGEGALEGAKNIVKGTYEFAKGLNEQIQPPTFEDMQTGAWRDRPKKALELGKGLTVDMIKGIAHNIDVVADPNQTIKEKTRAAIEAAGGMLATHGLTKDVAGAFKGPKPGEAGAASGEPSTTASPTPEQVAARQAELASLKQTEEATVADKAARKSALLKAVNVWNPLTDAQRKTIFGGMADADYKKAWSDLDMDARKVIYDKLTLEFKGVSNTKLYTSEPTAEAPPPVVEPTAPQAIPPEGSAPGTEGVAPPSTFGNLKGRTVAERAKEVYESITPEDKIELLGPEYANKSWDQLPPTIQEALVTNSESLESAFKHNPQGVVDEINKAQVQEPNPLADVTRPPDELGGAQGAVRPNAPVVPDPSLVSPVGEKGAPTPGAEGTLPPAEPLGQERLGKIEQSIKDKTNVERLVSEDQQIAKLARYVDAIKETDLTKYDDNALNSLLDEAEDLLDKVKIKDQLEGTTAGDLLKQARTAIEDEFKRRDAGGETNTPGSDAQTELDSRAADQLARETSGHLADKPMGQYTAEELQAAIKEVGQRILNDPENGGLHDTLEALRDLLDEKNALTPSDPYPESITSQSMEIERLINEDPKARLENLDAALDALDKAMDNGSITIEQYEEQLFRIADMKKAIKAAAPAEVVPPSGRFKMPDTMGKPLEKFSREQLLSTKKSISALLASPDVQKSPVAAQLKAELDRIFDHEATRRMMNEGGFLYLGKPKARPGLTPSEEYFSKKVISDPNLSSPWSWMKQLRDIASRPVKALRTAYAGILRPSHHINVAMRLYEGASKNKLATHQDAGKLMDMADGWLTKSEAFLKGDGPFIPDGQGGAIPTGAPSLARVIEMVKGQREKLDWLWLARRALDLKAKTGRDIGVDLGHAQELFLTSPEAFHQAVDAGRQYHTGLAEYGAAEGLIRPETLQAFQHETSYGPIQRMFGEEALVGKMLEEIKRTGKSAREVLASQPFQKLKGSKLAIRSMTEASVDVTHRIMRAATMNRIGLELTGKAKAEPKLYQGMIDPLTHREQVALNAEWDIRADAVKALFEEEGINISNEHAKLFANALSDEALNGQGGVLRVIENGDTKGYRIDEGLLQDLKSMTPTQLWTSIRMLGIPAHSVRMGIVLDPTFIMNALTIDQFQGWFNTKYNFRPVYDSFRGWLNIVGNSDAFKESIRAGGIEASRFRGQTTIHDVIAGPNAPPLELAAQQIKTMHPLKAINTILTPLREATRMGEYLRAREHGATPIEAAFAARDLLGNYSVQGSWATVRALNHMAAFSRPALAVLDKTARTIRERPAQWFSRAATLAAVAAALYVANEGDDEITQLRQTPGGQRWFYFRVGKEVYKWRKPFFEGAIMASGMEAFLDDYKGNNPDAYNLWAKSILQELSTNMLPVAGVVPLEIWANKRVQGGGPVVSDQELGLDPEYRNGSYSGTAERIVGRATGTSPAIINQVVRGTTGYLGESAVKAVSAAIDWVHTGELPPAEDLPLTQRLIAKYPSMSVGPIREFYERAGKVDQAAKTLNYVANHEPDRVEEELTQHQAEMPLIELYNQSREQIADLRRAVQSIDDIQDLGPQQKKVYKDQFLRQIIQIAVAANAYARALQVPQE